MNNFLVKIIICLLVLVLFSYAIASKGNVPTFKSEYDDVGLFDKMYDTANKEANEAVDSLEETIGEDGGPVSEKLYTSVPEFFENLFSTLGEGLGSWNGEPMDVEGVKQDSKSLIEKIFKLFPYTE